MKTAIIIPYNKQEEITIEVLERIEQTTFDEDIYVIVVNGYIETPNPIEHEVIDELITIKNESYCKTINEGLRAIPEHCTHVLMMGNDSFPDEEGWITKLEELRTKYDLKIISPDYTRGGKDKIVNENEDIWYHTMLPSITYFMKKEDFQKIGLMDERFTGACYYSDDDYSRRVINEYGDRSIGRVKNMLWEHRLSVEGQAIGVANGQQMRDNYKIYNDKWK